MPPRINASLEMAQFMQLGPKEESLPWTFYDIQDFAAGVSMGTEIRFYARQQNGTTVTAEDTNLFTASQVAAEGQRFLAQALCMNVLPAASDTKPVTSGDLAVTDVTEADDRVLVMNRGYLFLQLLGQKTYIEGSPISLFPAGFGVSGALAVSTTDATTEVLANIVNNGLPTVGNNYRIMVPIPSKTTVNVVVRYPKGAITPVSALRFGAWMNGILYRAIQ